MAGSCVSQEHPRFTCPRHKSPRPPFQKHGLHLQAPSLEDEEGVDAAQMLAELVGGGARLQAEVHGRERLQATGKQWGGAAAVKLSLVLRAAPGKPSINAQIVEAGLARVAVPKVTRREKGGGLLM